MTCLRCLKWASRICKCSSMATGPRAALLHSTGGCEALEQGKVSLDGIPHLMSDARLVIAAESHARGQKFGSSMVILRQGFRTLPQTVVKEDEPAQQVVRRRILPKLRRPYIGTLCQHGGGNACPTESY